MESSSLAEWIAETERSPEYKRERFMADMARRYRREEWRRAVIREAKTRRLNNLCRAIGRSYSMPAKWGFEC